jgi:hypothetical protein
MRHYRWTIISLMALLMTLLACWFFRCSRLLGRSGRRLRLFGLLATGYEAEYRKYTECD